MRKAVRYILDTGVEFPVVNYAIALVLSVLIVWKVPVSLLHAFVGNSLPAIPGVAFSLFGFAITAVSILTSLKESKFFELLQRVAFGRWKELIAAFIQEAGLYSVFGLFTLVINAQQIAALTGWVHNVVLGAYIFLFLTALLLTVSAVYLLRLVANTSPVVTPTVPPIDASALQGFQDPTSQLPPRQL